MCFNLLFTASNFGYYAYRIAEVLHFFLRNKGDNDSIQPYWDLNVFHKP